MLENPCLRVDDSDSSFQAIVEGALASTASKHLGFDNHIISACSDQQNSRRNVRHVSTDMLRYALCFSRRAGNLAFWYANAILPIVSFT